MPSRWAGRKLWIDESLVQKSQQTRNILTIPVHALHLHPGRTTASLWSELEVPGSYCTSNAATYSIRSGTWMRHFSLSCCCLLLRWIWGTLFSRCLSPTSFWRICWTSKYSAAKIHPPSSFLASDGKSYCSLLRYPIVPLRVASAEQRCRKWEASTFPCPSWCREWISIDTLSCTS